ncbi:MAG: DUF1538 domain-containing protein [Oscillospiraceae bacterium]
MNQTVLRQLKEAALSVLPLCVIIFALHMTLVPIPNGTLALFVPSIFLLLFGMLVFSAGAEMSMIPIGEAIGAELTRSRKLWLIIGAGFFLGIIVTVAEPDLQVLTNQVPALPNMTLVAAVAAGVGVFLVIALLRIIFQLSLALIFVLSYGLVFIAAAVFAPDFLAVAFDSGGVTTGPITVPFILSMGIGISAIRGSRSAEEDSFGICALCSIGPVIAILIVGIFFNSAETGYAFEAPEAAHSISDVVRLYGAGLAKSFKDVLSVLLPIVVIFLLLQVLRLKLSRTSLVRIVVGLVYTLVGITLFLTGINIGFLPTGTYLGETLAARSDHWILIPLSGLIGFFVVYAEPAVHVLNKQVEEITGGAISRKMMMFGLSFGVGMGLVLSVVRIFTGISLWYFVVPGYAIALVLMKFSPKIFTAIAFDSGGVAAGTMTAAFILPFAIGVCNAVGGNVMTDAFGIISMVAMMPLITIQALGALYNRKLKKNAALEAAQGDLYSEEVLLESLLGLQSDEKSVIINYSILSAEEPPPPAQTDSEPD